MVSRFYIKGILMAIKDPYIVRGQCTTANEIIQSKFVNDIFFKMKHVSETLVIY